MFVCLGGGIASNALRRRNEPGLYFRLYGLIVVAMAAASPLLFIPWSHRILVLEAIEIALFAVFWIVQTNELWHTTVDQRQMEAAPAS